MTKKLKEILAKKPEELTDVEKALLIKHRDELSDKQKKKFEKELGEEEDGQDDEDIDDEDDEDDEDEEDEDEDDEGITEGELKKLLDKNINSRADAIADRLVDKFFKGAKKERAKILEKGLTKEEKQKKADDVTREFMKALLAGDTARAKAMTTSTSGASPDDSKAGITIPTELLSEVLRFIPDYGICRREMRYLPFGGPGNTRDITALAASVRVFWTGEGAKKKSIQPTFAPVVQTLKKLAAICPMTEEILEDTLIPLNSLLGELFAEAIGIEEDYQFLAGVGSPWTGVLNNTSVNMVYQGVAGVENVTADDLLNMQDEIPTAALPGSKYILNRRSLNRIRKIKDLDGNYIYQRPSGGLPATIWDFPFELTDALPAPDAVQPGDPWIIFGNLKKCAILGDKQQIRVKILEEATITDTDDQTAINLGEQDEIAMRVVERVGYVLALPQGISVLKNEVESGS